MLQSGNYISKATTKIARDTTCLPDRPTHSRAGQTSPAPRALSPLLPPPSQGHPPAPPNLDPPSAALTQGDVPTTPDQCRRARPPPRRPHRTARQPGVDRSARRLGSAAGKSPRRPAARRAAGASLGRRRSPRRGTATKTTSSGWRGCWTWKAGPRPSEAAEQAGGCRPRRGRTIGQQPGRPGDHRRRGRPGRPIPGATGQTQPRPPALDAAGRGQPGGPLAGRRRHGADGSRRRLRARRSARSAWPWPAARGPGRARAWRLDLSYDEVAVAAAAGALEQASSARGDRLADLRDVLLGAAAAGVRRDRGRRPLDAGLNESQREAVQFALRPATWP